MKKAAILRVGALLLTFSLAAWAQEKTTGLGPGKQSAGAPTDRSTGRTDIQTSNPDQDNNGRIDGSTGQNQRAPASKKKHRKHRKHSKKQAGPDQSAPPSSAGSSGAEGSPQ